MCLATAHVSVLLLTRLVCLATAHAPSVFVTAGVLLCLLIDTALLLLGTAGFECVFMWLFPVMSTKPPRVLMWFIKKSVGVV